MSGADNIMNTIFGEMIKPGKTEKTTNKVDRKTRLFTMRMPEKVYDDFQELCFEKKRRTGKPTNMSKEILDYIYDRLESGK